MSSDAEHSLPDSQELDELTQLATTIAHQAGELLLDKRRHASNAIQTKSSITDLTTQTDRASEDLIVSSLRSARPNDALLAEEGTQFDGTSGIRWVIDPLDGTSNYVYDIASFAVSIAAEMDGETIVGVVHDPSKGETFIAAKGMGATCNGVPLKVTGTATLETALVATGFGYTKQQRLKQAAILADVIGHVRDIRRIGSAALDLCWVANGRFDAYFESGTQPWDVAAGRLIVSEAGGWVGTIANGEEQSDQIIMASSKELSAPLLNLITAACGME